MFTFKFNGRNLSFSRNHAPLPGCYSSADHGNIQRKNDSRLPKKQMSMVKVHAHVMNCSARLKNLHFFFIEQIERLVLILNISSCTGLLSSKVLCRKILSLQWKCIYINQSFHLLQNGECQKNATFLIFIRALYHFSSGPPSLVKGWMVVRWIKFSLFRPKPPSNIPSHMGAIIFHIISKFRCTPSRNSRQSSIYWSPALTLKWVPV